MVRGDRQKVADKFTVGLVQELMEEVITEVVGTIKVELDEEQPKAQCPAGGPRTLRLKQLLLR